MTIEAIDFTKLLGFASVTDHLQEGVDFRDADFGAKLGAKVGLDEPTAPAIDYGQLLGFETVSDHTGAIDFRDDTVGAKLGAKVGDEPSAPAVATP
jgi:hypothetical protein